MAIIRGGNAEYKSSGPSSEEKKEKLEKLIYEMVYQKLDRIELSGKYIGLDEVKILGSIKLTKEFKSLILSDNQVDNDGLMTLLDSEYLTNLESLDLGINFITDSGIKNWAELDQVRLERLKILSLNDNRLGDESISTFLLSSHATSIEILNLDYTQVGNGACKALAQSSGLTNIKELHLERGYINDEGIKDFLEWEGLEGLQVLKLTSNQLTDEGIEEISRSSRLKSIKKLDLGCNQISDKGCNALAESNIIENLDFLTLSRNPFTEEGAQKLKELKISGRLKNLILYEGVDNSPNLQNYSRPELLRPDAE
jgi:Ran GTPase-activating protein (RanGAP) involved in mRNA processing and transport